MKITPFWAIAVLTQASAVFAQGLRQATGGPEPTTIVQWYPTPTPEVSNCTASLITTLCDYKPKTDFAIASSGYKHCWEYCNAHQPCDFVIFLKGNPYTGTGTCWLYPGEKFDESAGTKGCDTLSVYDKPTCAEPTPTSGACTATSSPSAIAEVCDYPDPDDDCRGSCTASRDAVDCLSQCAEGDRPCSYALFKTGDERHSPYAPGTCWMYPNGTYDASKAGTCSGKPDQYVYNNPCPKPLPSSSPSASSSPSESASPSGGSGNGSGDASANAEGANKDKESPGKTGGAAAVGLPFGSVLAVSMALFLGLCLL